MKLLLDTHTFLWFISGSPRLNHFSRDLIENIENKRYLSIASLWELAIKISLDKIRMRFTFQELINSHIENNDINILMITPEHLNNLINLPFYHRDPFDRLIISQALIENMSIISCDTEFQSYNITVLW